MRDTHGKTHSGLWDGCCEDSRAGSVVNAGIDCTHCVHTHVRPCACALGGDTGVVLTVDYVQRELTSPCTRLSGRAGGRQGPTPKCAT